MKSSRSLLPVVLVIAIGSANPLVANAQRARDNQLSSQLLYELLERIELLERELRQLRGDLEILQHRQNRTPGDPSLERRLQALEQRLGQNGTLQSSPQPNDSILPAPPSEPTLNNAYESNNNSNSNSNTSTSNWQLSTESNSAQVTPPPASGLEQDDYNQALEQLRSGQYQQAATAFQAFIDNYPNNNLTGNAYYWLGESLYVSRDFDGAKQAFLTLGAQYPNSEKLPDTLLKLGYVYSELGDRELSKQVLGKLIDAFPESYAANLAEKHLRLLR